ncbi:energy-coupling factor ABC transporter ATP-binding protein [Tuwongella immobilis]|uniref:ABC transporter domain-containing protein n=1 Tax=Tuwongella immobilis TaxID=692036 RepID=A0A6C2YSN9_9BACT|nr:energy-coupling factor ABC transporter ATP-binding protein [Tuwongella immobilis]VIP04384.1 abc-type cobalt transport atpase component : Sulfate-transporting ATPase OS=Stanieria cyanosphaera (strain ATCC 29371 / PCC 7437) GN=Sta7437_3971 PE=4 SV=1: ABC_tran [Tuwongella immobilis]VTS06130.1 abc-type cobalt transport atpase component : Sulfate-transporting ATPase OS=Stanieria cyanosphaera (strain ATCC 29371 / PCC 7437) GN=Sta7437_3971 PE=4 SV=1: ABC_tran [Tuwongella immobilis]
MSSDDAVLQLSGLSHRYHDGRESLRSISLTIPARQRVGLIGANGAGKTTLLLAITGVIPTAPGMVRVAGLDPSKPAERKRLPSEVGLIFQSSDDQLFCMSVADDVAFGPMNLGLSPDEVRQRVQEAIAQTGLTGLEERPPFALSGGQKRRAALAGVLAMRPRLLLLDEPTMFLDPRGRRELSATLAQWHGTLMIASHDLDFVLASCDRVVLLDAGEVVTDGLPATVMADAALMEAHGLEVPAKLMR